MVVPNDSSNSQSKGFASLVTGQKSDASPSPTVTATSGSPPLSQGLFSRSVDDQIAGNRLVPLFPSNYLATFPFGNTDESHNEQDHEED
jgi:hypothetical protein